MDRFKKCSAYFAWKNKKGVVSLWKRTRKCNYITAQQNKKKKDSVKGIVKLIYQWVKECCFHIFLKNMYHNIYIYIFINLEKDKFPVMITFANCSLTRISSDLTNKHVHKKHRDVNIYRQCQCWKLGKIFKDSSFIGPDRCLWVLHHKPHRPSTT